MQRWFVSVSLTCVLAVATAGALSAQVEIQVQAQPAVQNIQIQVQAQPAIQVADRAVAMPAVMYNQNRLLQSDAILVGRVVAIEPMDVEATPGPGQPKVTYRVAVIQVTEAIVGLKPDAKMVRVGFIAQPNNLPPNQGNIQILPAIQPVPPGQPFPGRRPYIGNIQLNLQVGQDGLFALAKHHKENFYVAPNATNFIPRANNANFDNEVRTAKQLSRAMADPIAALKAEDKQDRYLAAAILITRYRSNTLGVPMKSVPIDAEESKLILKALQGGDWTVGRFNASVPNPFELFNQLQINQKDGYNPPNNRDQAIIATAMQKWLDENNGKYIIQKLVADPNAKAQPPVNVDPAQPVPPVVRPPIRINPKVKIQPLPIKGKVQIRPAPAIERVPAQPLPIEIEAVPPQPAPAPAQPRRE